MVLLKGEGMTGRDIAAVLGISEQRVSQLATSASMAA
ncbi:sigma factor-like helix-turn-helix DNA-binding protein [Glycomyces tritici]|uniref:Sigma factor-like helix-turn-helix DNA-binding protein n=1 Tax=Glycomyces tritici TaxID=2665176 RepID=A0ABT7YMB3_9ACTN|nr:sigma factor-like helix-turn-helix DNA-binding protein [Glycomyces tritici]MDN3239767.1 sigma factor-like helix-turn-helix DNA-binding protein [Glycomyces tritici]